MQEQNLTRLFSVSPHSCGLWHTVWWLLQGTYIRIRNVILNCWRQRLKNVFTITIAAWLTKITLIIECTHNSWLTFFNISLQGQSVMCSLILMQTFILFTVFFGCIFAVGFFAQWPLRRVSLTTWPLLQDSYSNLWKSLLLPLPLLWSLLCGYQVKVHVTLTNLSSLLFTPCCSINNNFFFSAQRFSDWTWNKAVFLTHYRQKLCKFWTVCSTQMSWMLLQKDKRANKHSALAHATWHNITWQNIAP